MAPRPPTAPPCPTRIERHGDVRDDEYTWMRRGDDPEALAYVRKENRYAAAVMRPHAGLERMLFQEMKQRYREDDEQVPERRGEFLYFWRSPRGKEHKVLYRRPVLAGALARTLLDLNAVAAALGVSSIHLGAVEPSPDHRRLAYTVDSTGGEHHRLFVVDVDAGTPPRLITEDVAPGLAWAADSRTLFCCGLNEVGQARLALRVDAERPGERHVVFREDAPSFFVSCRRSRSGEWIFIVSSSNTSDEIRTLRSAAPGEAPRLLRARAPGVELRVAHHGRHFYVLTNDQAPAGRILRAPVAGPAEWREVLPHRPDRLLERIDMFRDHLAVQVRRRGLPTFSVIELSTGRRHTMRFGEPAYELTVLDNPEFDTGFLRFSYSSPLSPRTVYDYDMSAGFPRTRKVREVLGAWDPTAYKLERIFAPAADDVRIPVTLLYRRGTRRNGRNPLYLEAYGAYGCNASLAFHADRFSLVDRGFVYAIAHVRGGQEMGRSWYDQGRLDHKTNSFSDYIACTEHLIRTRWTGPGLVVASGTSAGGMIAGVVANERPELYRAVVAHVPFVDVLSTMEDSDQVLTANEYEEWGDPAVPEDYARMRAYSPFDNVRAQGYPHMLVFSAFNDVRVPFWEAARWVARLRARKTDDNLLLLKTDMDAGHAGRPGRFAHLHERAFEAAFLLAVAGRDGSSAQ